MSLDVLASLKWPANGWSWWLWITCKRRISWSGMYRCPWNLSCPSTHSQPKGRSEVPNLLHRSWVRGFDSAIQAMSMMMALWSRSSDTICSASPDMPEHIARCGSSSCSGARTSCQSMTLHIELRTFPMHLQCISKALLHTLMHCVLDSACYATLHCPLHLHLHTCHLHLFVCLFTFVTSTHVACFVCLFPLPDWFR